MRKTLLFNFLVTALCLLFSGLHSVTASHFQGGELTYTPVTGIPNRYKVTLRIFRDCGGAALPTSVSLLYRNTGCGFTGSTITMPLIGGSSIGSPYCASAPSGPNPCGAGLPTNYQTGRFEATVTLPPSAEWRLSVEVNARPTLGNTQGDTDMYYEATLNNLINNQSISNSSAKFDSLNVPIPFVCYQQQTTLNFTATDADGDELVYSLAAPLQGCNDPLPYQRFSVGSNIDLTAQNGGSPCVGTLPNGGVYSPTLPIASFAFTGNCPVKTGTSTFLFNPSIGSFTFTPYFYDNAINSAKNKYVVVGRVAEYRLVGGIRTLIGTVRRDILVVVINCANGVPATPVASGNNANSGVQIVNTNDSTFITASTCNYTRVLVRFTDPNPNDLLSVTYPALVATSPSQTTYLPEDVGTFRVIGNGTRRPIGVLDLQPDVFYKDQTFRIPVQIRDNGCPVIGQQSRVIVISVKGRNSARIVAAANTTSICVNTSVSLTASLARPDSVLQGIGTPTPLPRTAVYTYRWDPADGLATADMTKPTITVRPSQTTRYRVHINAQDFRQQPIPTCVDTSSILIRVTPTLTARFLVVSRAAFSLNGIADKERIPPRIFTFQNTSVVPRPANSTDTAAVISTWTYQRIADVDKNPLTGEPEVTFSRRFTPNELILREGGTYRFRLHIINRAGTTDCPSSEATQEQVVRDFETPNVFTPNKDGKNDVFVLTRDEIGSKVQIFNRWGRMVKEYASYQNDWDGADQPAGVYYYLLTDRNGKTSKGWVELTR
ncbi:gliding motility-associated C-terminal domain-containing protein [uncultured Hymenobacter sp.]|uniref:gliding motility-associated C-terminal domain-containing protein n=1 Tax=uncultured Hymenobacter sp. TaxID=170016 RepID=UPI0035CA00A7